VALETVLWFEHDVFDQLNLIQLLTWFREQLQRHHLPVGVLAVVPDHWSTRCLVFADR
jgi:hypothetical protein